MKAHNNEPEEAQTDNDDPLAPIREHRDAVERLADDRSRDDNLDAAARVLLAVADGDRPAAADLEAWGLTTDERYQSIRYGSPAAGLGPSPVVLRRLSRAVHAVLGDSTKGAHPR